MRDPAPHPRLPRATAHLEALASPDRGPTWALSAPRRTHAVFRPAPQCPFTALLELTNELVTAGFWHRFTAHDYAAAFPTVAPW